MISMLSKAEDAARLTPCKDDNAWNARIHAFLGYLCLRPVAFVLHLSKAVHAELKGTGVSITALCPGSTQTEFARKSGMEQTLLFQLFVMKPESVAKSGYRAMMKGQHTAVPGVYNKLLVLSAKLLPYALTQWMTKKMMRPRIV